MARAKQAAPDTRIDVIRRRVEEQYDLHRGKMKKNEFIFVPARMWADFKYMFDQLDKALKGEELDDTLNDPEEQEALVPVE